MTTPATGYSLESVHTVQASYSILLEGRETLGADRDIGFTWDWRFVAPGRFEVLLGAQVGPRDEVPDRLEALVVGTFEVVGEVQSVEVLRFVELNAPALLMPYLRQALTSLSAHGPMGPFYLPPINVRVLSADFDLDNATGIAQLEQDPSLVEQASVDRTLQTSEGPNGNRVLGAPGPGTGVGEKLTSSQRSRDMAGNSHHVVPNSDGGWDVRRANAERVSKHFDTKKEAVDAGRVISRNQKTELVIHRQNGTIEKKDSHGYDPRNVPG